LYKDIYSECLEILVQCYIVINELEEAKKNIYILLNLEKTRFPKNILKIEKLENLLVSLDA